MPKFRGKEFDEIRSWIFEGGEDLFVCHNGVESKPGMYANITAAESEHAIRVLGCISGAFKTQGESNT